MAIPEDLQKLVDHGDWKIIADLFNQKHKKKITPSYILKVVRGSSAANDGTTAAQILPFAEEYLKNKKAFREKLNQES